MRKHSGVAALGLLAAALVAAGASAPGSLWGAGIPATLAGLALALFVGAAKSGTA